MRYIKQTLLMIFASMALVACGTGTDDTTIQNPPLGNISVSSDFRATKFPAIVVGGTYAAASTIMATLPAGTPSAPTFVGTVYTYEWITGAGNTLEYITITTAGASGSVLTKNYRNADGVKL